MQDSSSMCFGCLKLDAHLPAFRLSPEGFRVLDVELLGLQGVVSGVMPFCKGLGVELEAVRGPYDKDPLLWV